jgi:alcohol dehydrogenase
MRAWQLDRPGGMLALAATPTPVPHAGAVLVRMHAVPLLSYTRAYVAGELPYAYPPGPFTIGTNGSGTVAAVGAGVDHVRPGDRVVVHPFYTADEPSDEPARILIGLTGVSANSAELLATWRNGTLAEFAHLPAKTVVPVRGLENVSATRLAVLGKFAVPMGGLVRGRLAPGETLVVHGASGYFGSAAVMLGVALGAERVVAVARRRRTRRAGQARARTGRRGVDDR